MRKTIEYNNKYKIFIHRCLLLYVLHIEGLRDASSITGRNNIIYREDRTPAAAIV